jgi:hypothetical protein
MIFWVLNQTGHFTCSQKRTFSLANDTEESAVIHPEFQDQSHRCSILASAIMRQLVCLGPFHGIHDALAD